MEVFEQQENLNLQWLQPKTAQRRYELRSEDKVLATLVFKSAFGSLAVGETATARWTFKRTGFFNPRVTVRREGEETDLAVYRPKWTSTSGTIEFTAGSPLVWKVANFWGTQFVIGSAEGEPLVIYRQGAEGQKLTDFLKNQARVEITRVGWDRAEIALLALLGFYLILLYQEDSAAATAVAASTAAS